MNHLYRCGFIAVRRVALLVVGFASVLANAQQHGQSTLHVVVDAQSITLQLEASQETLVGFSGGPRESHDDKETWKLVEMYSNLLQDEKMFQMDPAGGCIRPRGTTTQVKLPPVQNTDEHAPIGLTMIFPCSKPSSARYVDAKLFEMFKGIRVISAQVDSPQGQFKRTLDAKSPRLSWGP